MTEETYEKMYEFIEGQGGLSAPVGTSRIEGTYRDLINEGIVSTDDDKLEIYQCINLIDKTIISRNSLDVTDNKTKKKKTKAKKKPKKEKALTDFPEDEIQ